MDVNPFKTYEIMNVEVCFSPSWGLYYLHYSLSAEDFDIREWADGLITAYTHYDYKNTWGCMDEPWINVWEELL